jgi:hypothetical protein
MLLEHEKNISYRLSNIEYITDYCNVKLSTKHLKNNSYEPNSDLILLIDNILNLRKGRWIIYYRVMSGGLSGHIKLIDNHGEPYDVSISDIYNNKIQQPSCYCYPLTNTMIDGLINSFSHICSDPYLQFALLEQVCNSFQKQAEYYNITLLSQKQVRQLT